MPIALGRNVFPSSSQLERGANALAAPTTPGNRIMPVDKSKVDPQSLQAAEGMEAMFLDYMMKTMRQTVPKNDMDLSNPGTEIYQGMMDSAYAQKAAHAGGIGLADQIVAYLESQRYTGNRGPRQLEQPAPAARQGEVSRPDPRDSTGGSHESQSFRK